MIKSLFFILSAEKTGGLFDFDGTLPLIILQFIILMIVLNLIFFTPLTNVIDERLSYINEILRKASKKLTQANQLNDNYNNQLKKFVKKINNNGTIIPKLYKENLEIGNQYSQKLIDKFIEKLTTTFEEKKLKIISNLQNEIDFLSNQILSKIVA